MPSVSVHDFAYLREIAKNDCARKLFLRMARLSREGRLEPFLTELAADEELDEGTKDAVAELAHEAPFLAAVEEYLRSAVPAR